MFTVNINQTIFKYGVFNIPNELIPNETVKSFKGMILSANEAYPVTITAQNQEFIPGMPLTYYNYRVYIGKALMNKLAGRFVHSYMTCLDANLSESTETISLTLSRQGEFFTLEEVGASVIENEYTNFFRDHIERNDLSDIKDDKKSGRYKNVLQHLSIFHPISDIKKVSYVKNSIYVWVSEDEKKIYIGSTNNLQRRLKEHLGIIKDSAKCDEKYGGSFNITHFAFFQFHGLIPMKTVETLELLLIKLGALLVPNRSNGKISPIINDTSWILVNGAYE